MNSPPLERWRKFKEFSTGWFCSTGFSFHSHNFLALIAVEILFEKKDCNGKQEIAPN
ncbi:hypothetical protein [Chryseobacterium geocarposphaerae]|uniref:Uncharacterized protein n=1 Tax=Chryseobacterium geocarposphaerae TaxID=1416776 RepID=A0A2M9CA50_9FLAO|nr:hypothetical protein [Chryseobacterium geocarposphaerae]PJJ67691.1 hypothetical protein CLV73_1709 [Chryseobacterium geocarposphaerae]